MTAKLILLPYLPQLMLLTSKSRALRWHWRLEFCFPVLPFPCTVCALSQPPAVGRALSWADLSFRSPLLTAPCLLWEDFPTPYPSTWSSPLTARNGFIPKSQNPEVDVHHPEVASVHICGFSYALLLIQACALKTATFTLLSSFCYSVCEQIFKVPQRTLVLLPF